MSISLSHIVVSIVMWMIVRDGTLCCGYVCLRTPSRFRHGPRDGRLRAEGPSTLSFPRSDTFTVETQKRRSKRKRLKSLFRRWRRRSPSASVHVALEETQSSNDVLRLEEIQERTVSQSSEETATNHVPEGTPTLHVEEAKAPDEHLTVSRQSTAAAHVDLSGTWKPIITEAFKKDYDAYLVHCGESFMFRKVVVNGIGYQREAIRQLDEGSALEIVATNPAGNWNRTLVTSDAAAPRNATLADPDGDRVQVESWWEGGGTRHRALLRGKPRVQGGTFDTVRYLESADVLVCESTFVPSPSSGTKFTRGHVVWKFRRAS